MLALRQGVCYASATRCPTVSYDTRLSRTRCELKCKQPYSRHKLTSHRIIDNDPRRLLEDLFAFSRTSVLFDAVTCQHGAERLVNTRIVGASAALLVRRLPGLGPQSSVFFSEHAPRSDRFSRAPGGCGFGWQDASPDRIVRVF
eukprot:3381584-Rhodomonas_salina.4